MTVTETDRAWLAGIWDGEGSITLFSSQEKNGNTKIRPVVSMCNTDLGIINKSLAILEDANCSVYIVKRKLSKNNSKHKDIYDIKTTATKQIECLLLVIEPYLYGVKKAKANILLRYVRRRMAKIAKVGRIDLATYDKEDWCDLHNIRSSETTRETPPTVNSVTR